MITTRTGLSSVALLALFGCARGDADGTMTRPIPDDPETKTMTGDQTNVYELTLNNLAGDPVDLSQYAGRVSLIVNVASACGYTPQYDGLQTLHEELSARGFQVLGFPCNDFGAQEPGSAEEIATFCRTNYGVTFPMFEKVGIQRAPAPIYQRLIAATGQTPGWNFCKYLVSREGKVLGFYESSVTPQDAALRQAIEAAL